eukprot:3208146-Amphidinium_carterae.1
MEAVAMLGGTWCRPWQLPLGARAWPKSCEQLGLHSDKLRPSPCLVDKVAAGRFLFGLLASCRFGDKRNIKDFESMSM